MAVPYQLKEIAEKIKKGDNAKTTVRTLLSWYDAYRRSWRNVKRINEDLSSLQLKTSPYFEWAYIDGTIDFIATESKDSDPVDNPVGFAKENSENIEVISDVDASITVIPRLADSVHRIGKLASANMPLISVSPDASIAEAITLMQLHDYSQLPVMQSSTAREVKGIITWKSIGSRLAAGKSFSLVRECMESHKEISADASLFDAVPIIAEHEAILVRAKDKSYSGIVTGYDINIQFKQLAEPFLLLGDIENHIRYLISASFSLADLQAIRDPQDTTRIVSDASSLTFGEYVRLLQNEENWKKLKINYDRVTFTNTLDKVREIRNDVMHFDPDPVDPDDMYLLKSLAKFLATWHKLT